MDAKYIQKIAEKSGLSVKAVTNVYNLHSEGSTIPFMARYRKEATGNLDEVAIGSIVEEVGYFSDLHKRKQTVIKTIEEAGKMNSDLARRIEDCYNSAELEDIYLPYKPKRKTKASQAIEKGLEPLAHLIFEQGSVNLEAEAAKYVNEQVADGSLALAGARDIIAEWIAENEQARAVVRKLFTEEAILSSTVFDSKKEEADAQKYRDYFEWSEPLTRIPSHRLLAIRRGEKEGFLAMSISIDATKAIGELENIFVKNSFSAAKEVNKAVEDSYKRLLKSSIETELRIGSRDKADEEAIRVFTENLRQLLLSSPLGAKKIMALDPGYRTGCKLVCLDEQGTLLFNTTIYPHPPQNQWQESMAEIKHLVDKYDIDAVAVGNGTAGRETETLVRNIDYGKQVSVYSVNESGASIYSASEAAREEFPDHDVTVRGAVSIGRRLLDPLSELVKIDPKSIGVGQYQHDVNQIKLKQGLDRVVESAVNFVGVDVNTASKHLLKYVSGITTTLAGNIVQYRLQNGAFKTREGLKKVPMMGPKSFEQCAGFLRISGAANPLDASSVHPESYIVVEEMARDLQASLEELIKSAELRKKINKKKYISDKAGEFTIEDILKELEKPGRDPRAPIEKFQFDQTIKTIGDVKPGMKVPGIVTNITAFGAFVDIGVKQDGLVHVSQLSKQFVSDPGEVVKLQQKVIVTVTEVDVARKRIALSMKDQAIAQAAPGRNKKENQNNPSGKKPILPDSFQDKLAELKKKFTE
jgi:uncharacterized protein